LSQDIYDNANAAVRQELVALHVYWIKSPPR
jgi:hypothetical protein